MSDNYPDNFFVEFHKYCELCKHHETDEAEYPCNSCLETPVRESTVVPEYYIPKNTK